MATFCIQSPDEYPIHSRNSGFEKQNLQNVTELWEGNTSCLRAAILLDCVGRLMHVVDRNNPEPAARCWLLPRDGSSDDRR
jgi:hypothetical protein